MNKEQIMERLQKAEKTMEERKAAKEAKEEMVMVVNEAVVEVAEKVQPVEEAPVKEELLVEEDSEAVKAASVVEGMVSKGSEGEVSVKSKLPIIKRNDKKVKLCEKEKYDLYMMPMCNAENLIVEGCKFYLVDKETKIPKIGAGHEIKIDKEKLMSSTEHNVMERIKKFEINFTEDDLKCAFEIAKEYLEKNGEMVKYSDSMNIQDAYGEVVAFAMAKSSQEESAKVMEGDRKCIYDKDKGIVEIKDGYLQDILNEIGAGFTKTVFCKKLCMLQEHYGVNIIIRNTNSRGYSYNKTGNVRYYTFRIVEELLNVEGGVV